MSESAFIDIDNDAAWADAVSNAIAGKQLSTII